MERGRSRYAIFGLTDGLFLGLGLSLGVSSFHTYDITFTSVLLAGVTGALSNMFSTYNAENFVSGQQISEYGEALFVRDYNPKKLAKSHQQKSVYYAMRSFIFTFIGSLIVLLPYVVFYLAGFANIFFAGISSLILCLIVLGFVGSYNQKETREKMKGALKTIGIGIAIAGLSTLIGILLSSIL